ncbi:MAG: hypothetical protein ABIP06_07545 [Pyrinomonadaceae bacterium]
MNQVTFLLAAIMFGICFAGFSDIHAQNKRRPKSKMPRTAATPVPSSTLTIPEIVRRADETDVENLPLATEETQIVDEQNDVETLKKRVSNLNAKIRKLETDGKIDADAKEKKLLMSLDILSRAEQRTESLRKQLYEVIEKENSVKARIEQLTYEMRPEMIDRNIAFTGSLRPEDLRDARSKSLESEKANLNSLVNQLQANREKLEQSVGRADLLVEKIRLKFEKEIDDALDEEEQP